MALIERVLDNELLSQKKIKTKCFFLKKKVVLEDDPSLSDINLGFWSNQTHILMQQRKVNL